MESHRARRKPNQHHQVNHGPMTSTVKKDGSNFIPTRNRGQPSTPTSPIPHTSRLSFANMSKSKRRKAPKRFLLIRDAIKAVGDEKKGASVQAIKKWILGNYPEIPQLKFNSSINNALMKGLDDGSLARPARSKINRGAFGSFLLVKKADKIKKTKKAPKVKVAVLPEAYSSDTELTINRGRAMSMRLNLSDTQLTEVRKSLVFKTNTKMRTSSLVKNLEGEDTDEDSEQWILGRNVHIKRLGGRSVNKVVAESDDENSNEDSEQEEKRNVGRNVHGGRSFQNVVAESDDEDSNEDSEQEEPNEPAVKAQTKETTKASKAAGIKTVAKTSRKAPPSKTKDKKENVPPKPKRRPKK